VRQQPIAQHGQGYDTGRQAGVTVEHVKIECEWGSHVSAANAAAAASGEVGQWLAETLMSRPRCQRGMSMETPARRASAMSAEYATAGTWRPHTSDQPGTRVPAGVRRRRGTRSPTRYSISNMELCQGDRWMRTPLSCAVARAVGDDTTGAARATLSA